MPRPLWNGAISFGLVTIPVSLFTARTADKDVRFSLLDRRDLRPVHNARRDDEGHEVPWDDVVRAYEYEKGSFVVLSDEELRAANVEATQTIDIAHFVDAAGVDPAYLDIPYYTEPARQGRKAYALLRETLARAGLIGIAKIVIRSRQRLCAVRPTGTMLVVQSLAWSYQMRDPAGHDLPGEDLQELGITDAELDMAARLVESMTAKWDPASYEDTYRDEVLRAIEQKVRTGTVAAVGERPAPEGSGGEVVDIMSLLKRSVEEAGGDARPKRGAHARRAVRGP